MEEIAELESILDDIIEGIRQMRAAGEEITPDLDARLSAEIDSITDELEQLYAQQDQQQQQQQPPQLPPPPSVQNVPSPDAQLLWVLAGQQEQAFISYLRDFPSEETQSLLRNPALLSQTIDQLSHMIPQITEPDINGIHPAELQSSNIWGTQYDHRTNKLKVRFQGGAEYEYNGVPANIYRAFARGNASAKTSGQNQYGRWWKMKNPSLGSAMHQYIKQGGYPYRRIR